MTLADIFLNKKKKLIKKLENKKEKPVKQSLTKEQLIQRRKDMMKYKKKAKKKVPEETQSVQPDDRSLNYTPIPK